MKKVLYNIKKKCFELFLAGTLIYVLNYTGDRLHFGMAVERFRSAQPDAKIDLLFIDDDISLESKKYQNTTGGRGLAGCVLVLHIAGVLADEYMINFELLRDITQNVINNLGFCISFINILFFKLFNDFSNDWCKFIRMCITWAITNV